MGLKVKIFGYGSLLFKDSLLKTVPSAKNIQSCRLYGFVRKFEFPSPSRISEIDGGSCAVLNIEKNDSKSYINGVYFEITLNDFDELKIREMGYDLVGVQVEDYFDKTKKFYAHTFIATDFEPQNYLKDSKVQKEYLNWCYEGCKKFGDDFLDDFKKSTYIEDKSLRDLRF